MTPATAAAPYLTPQQLLQHVDWRVVADLAADVDADGPRPSKRSLTDPAAKPGAVVAAHTLAASGELETALVAGQRYAVADVQALLATTAGGMYLVRLLASLTHWSLAQRRDPASADAEDVPGAKAALGVLEALRKGERILPFQEAAQAGGGPTPMRNYRLPQEAGGSRTVEQAGRLFDVRQVPGDG
jgi:hypothetical protein